MPADDATNVPRNIELRITYSSGLRWENGAGAVLETSNGQVVPTTWEKALRGGRGTGGTQIMIGRPQSPLAASTRYRVRHLYQSCDEVDAGLYRAPCEQGLCVSSAGEVISEFTTGTQEDQRVLASPALGAPVFSRVESAESTGSGCATYSRCIYTVDAPDLPRGTLLRVTRDGHYVNDFGGDLSIGVGLTGVGFDWFVDLYGAGDYQVALVDEIGNQSAKTALSVPFCTQPDGGVADRGVVDGGTTPSGASPVSVDGGTVNTGYPGPQEPSELPPLPAGSVIQSDAASESEDGCSLTSTHSSWMSGLWVALAILVKRRRRL